MPNREPMNQKELEDRIRKNFEERAWGYVASIQDSDRERWLRILSRDNSLGQLREIYKRMTGQVLTDDRLKIVRDYLNDTSSAEGKKAFVDLVATVHIELNKDKKELRGESEEGVKMRKILPGLDAQENRRDNDFPYAGRFGIFKRE